MHLSSMAGGSVEGSPLRSRGGCRGWGGESLFRRRLQDKHASNQSIKCAFGIQGRKLSDSSIEAIQRETECSGKCRLIVVLPHR